MSEDREAEIRASVGAHQDLGSAYDDAVAEGLVERIGAEIDKRIDARLGWLAPPPARTSSLMLILYLPLAVPGRLKPPQSDAAHANRGPCRTHWG
jgi:hypothetical protein